MKRRGFRKGFTLLELIIVILIVGVLSSLALLSYGTLTKSANSKTDTIYKDSVQVALNSYFTKHLIFPSAVQPNKGDTTDASKTGYAIIDFSKLIQEGYLDQVPKLEKGKFFAVDYNGQVKIVSAAQPIVLINNGDEVTGDPSISVSVFLYNQDGTNYTSTGATYSLTGDVTTPLSNVSYNTTTPSANVKSMSISNPTNGGEKVVNLTVKYADGSTYTTKDSIQFLVTSTTDGDSPSFSGNTLIANYDSVTRYVNLSWGDVQDATGIKEYSIYRKLTTDTNFPSTPIVKTSRTSYSDGYKFTANTSYDYAVVATDGAGNVTPMSDALRATVYITTVPSFPCTITLANPGDATGTRTNATNPTLITATITNPVGVDSAYVYMKRNGSASWEVMNMTKSSGQNDVYEALVPVENYTYYYIVAQNTRGDKNDNSSSVTDGYYKLISTLVQIYSEDFSTNQRFELDGTKYPVTGGINNSVSPLVTRFHWFNKTITLP